MPNGNQIPFVVTADITLNLRGNGQHDFARIASPIQKCRTHLSPQALNDCIVQNQSGEVLAGSAPNLPDEARRRSGSDEQNSTVAAGSFRSVTELHDHQH